MNFTQHNWNGIFKAELSLIILISAYNGFFVYIKVPYAYGMHTYKYVKVFKFSFFRPFILPTYNINRNEYQWLFLAIPYDSYF